MSNPRNDALQNPQGVAEQLAAWAFATERGAPPTPDALMITAQQIQDYLSICEGKE